MNVESHATLKSDYEFVIFFEFFHFKIKKLCLVLYI